MPSGNYVQKVTGKGLSTNDLTDNLKSLIPTEIGIEVANKSATTQMFSTLNPTWNANEIKIMPYIKGIYVQSVSSVYERYAFSQIRRGSSTQPTSFFILWGPAVSKGFTRTLSVGAVSGIVKYNLACDNGDNLVFWVDWDNATIAAGELVVLGTDRTTISKTIYGVKIPETNVNFDLVLPNYIPIALGRELNIWKENISEATAITENDTRCDIFDSANIYSNCGPANGYKYQIGTLGSAMPAVPAPFNVTVQRKSWSGGIYNSGTVQVRPTSNVFNSAATKVILTIADSHADVRVQGRLYSNELKSIIVANSSFIPSFIGTCVSLIDSAVKNEGRSSWSTDSFVGAGLSGTPSPFVFAGVFNFSQYMSTNGFASCDILDIQLGSNDMYSITVAQYIANLKIIIDSARVFNPNMKIIVGMPTMGAMASSSGNFIKTGIIPFLRAIVSNFTTYLSTTGVPVIICPTYLVCNRMRDWNVALNSSRDGTGYQFDTQHLNTIGYQRQADIRFSAMMYALNN